MFGIIRALETAENDRIAREHLEYDRAHGHEGNGWLGLTIAVAVLAAFLVVMKWML